MNVRNAPEQPSPGPFSSALGAAFAFGLAACVIAALASLVPGKGQPFTDRRRGRAATAVADSGVRGSELAPGPRRAPAEGG